MKTTPNERRRKRITKRSRVAWSKLLFDCLCPMTQHKFRQCSNQTAYYRNSRNKELDLRYEWDKISLRKEGREWNS
ncbi:uncharacterized protein An02g10570 [Aspergillus niger]|uniref:Contig An02c0310, genomic contig n=2 Tax=Aspergillus niger TaxID=5061 RepID=A5AAG4_ASPNC|nr:uncharacterized protein An02g10570 [Aspergillus niger]CAK44406.1 unnamed protein product [Aspergillus niger]